MSSAGKVLDDICGVNAFKPLFKVLLNKVLCSDSSLLNYFFSLGPPVSGTLLSL